MLFIVWILRGVPLVAKKGLKLSAAGFSSLLRMNPHAIVYVTPTWNCIGANPKNSLPNARKLIMNIVYKLHILSIPNYLSGFMMIGQRWINFKRIVEFCE